MLKSRTYIFAFTMLVLLTCSTTDDAAQNEPPIGSLPSNLTLNTEVQGVDSINPHGDGSGVVNFVAEAANAVRYAFIIDGSSAIPSSDGTFQFTFNTKEGIDNHDITVVAYSSSKHTLETSTQLAVAFYNGKPPVWADEFFNEGKPDTQNWTYDIGAGGWGNNELQTYTNSINNALVENGVLKIIAKSEGSSGYTSARLKTENLKEFKYGTLKVRAKLPSSMGTWPAIWMLGANFDTVGWPHCGEIDIMEQTGTDKTKVLATCHWYESSILNKASYGLDTTISNAANQFHIYTMEWTETTIKIFVDDLKYYEIALNNNLPFNQDFFLLLNIAIGGTLGGDVPTGFTQDTMEIDYVRLYQ